MSPPPLFERCAALLPDRVCYMPVLRRMSYAVPAADEIDAQRFGGAGACDMSAALTSHGS